MDIPAMGLPLGEATRAEVTVNRTQKIIIADQVVGEIKARIEGSKIIVDSVEILAEFKNQ